ncbi:lycopene cyclase domain-containing protein [Urechidicola croceus]|uniref:Lycopene cyclase n=1 Tax=Urechidicola croceus TaxID=1850246 RepID=A0A1D8P3V8_9FLAO|nr:lycopene cyclase domain-containing protein [Urechidicola croceus]AOW19206.1 lycopene cyclase [Urechidicola croceus]
MSLYLIVNIASFTIPFFYSFEKKMRFIQYWKSVFLAISITAFFFIIWDIIFTHRGIWGFNSKYLVGIDIFGLPLEEILFFIFIPYSSIFMHYALVYFFPKVKLTVNVTRTLTLILFFILFITLVFNTDKSYTLVNYSLCSLLLAYAFFFEVSILQRFYWTFLCVLIPFFVVNGILTGSFIEEPVVWYNNAENLRIRLGTIPIEDIVYAFSMLFLSVVMIEKFKPLFAKNE